jgi:NAD-dependent deacetylase
VSELDLAVDELALRLARATRVTVLTGAGVSAASGVPTFRGEDGLWRTYRAEELATPQAFTRDPALVWTWYDWRRQRIAGCRPNQTHQALARWRARFPGLTVVTQNVDGLHEAAGLTGVMRLHGSIWHLRCWSDCPGRPVSWRDERVPLPEIPARCRHCGGIARPDVVWFGEPLDAAVVAAASRAAACDVFISAGTSALVYPAAGFLHEARSHGAWTVEINPDATPASRVVDLRVSAPAEIVFDRLDQILGASAPRT